MGTSTPRPTGTVPAASYGDLVCGLASTAPPLSYVGELGAATDAASQSVVSGLLRSAGASPRTKPEVKVNGRTLGTMAEVIRAIPASPMQALARIWTGSGIARVAGQSITLQGAPAHVVPTSALADLGGGQTVLKIRGTEHAVEPPDEDADGLGISDARRSVPPRTNFELPADLHLIVSQCSAARRLDLAPVAYQMLVGDPVDVVTGSVVVRATDFVQPWPAFRLERRYDSRKSGRCSAFGHGWTHELDQAVWLEPGRVVLRDGHGREHEFSTMMLPGRVCRPGDVLHDPARRLRLRCVVAGQYEVSDGRTLRQFGLRDSEPELGLVRLTRLVDREGQLVECVYEPGPAGPNGVRLPALLVEVRLDATPLLRFEYDGTGLVRRVSSMGPHGAGLVEATYQYSPDRDLVTVTDPDGRAQRYAYGGHLLVEEASRDGARFHYGYDGFGPRARCVRAWGEGGYLDRTLEHDPTGGRTLVRDGLGHETIYRHDAAGLVTEVVAPDGQRVVYRYDGQLRLVEVTHADGTAETAEYDALGNLSRRTGRDGAAWTMEHDARGRLSRGTDPQGGVWQFHHDERGRLRQVQDPAGHLMLFEFERGGCRVLDATGHAVRMTLDAHDRVTEMPGPDGERLRFAYDERGRLVEAWAGDGRQRWRYDRSNRLVRHDGPGTRTTYQRDAEGEVTAVERDGRAIRIDRDAFGVIRAIDDGTQAVTYAHDREGRLVRAEQDGRELLSLEHGPDGHVSAWSAPGVGRGEVRREAKSGRVASLRLGDDRVELEHDAAGRITRLVRDGGGESTYAYRPDGYLVAATNERVACTFERDPMGAVTEQRWGDVVVGEASPDQRGRRGGLRLSKRGRLSYLRSREGAVERIAVVADGGAGGQRWDEPQELSPVPSPDEPTIPVPSFEVGTFDALGRPVSARALDHVVWDEDRIVAIGDVLLVNHPDDGRPLYAIDGKGRARPLAPSERPVAGAASPVGPLDGRLAAAFPAVAPSSVTAAMPRSLLAGLLGHRAWIPQVRPVPGAGPWDPDVWGPRVEAPEPDIGRLDTVTLLRALGSPFPRTELEVRSFDRRLPPPEPVP